MSYKEFLQGRVCRGDQARQDYEDYLKDCEDEEEDSDVHQPILGRSSGHSVD